MQGQVKCFDLSDGNRCLVGTVDENNRARLTVWSAKDCDDGIHDPYQHEMDLTDPARALSGQNMQQLADEIQNRRPTWLRLHQLSIDMTQFCQTIVPQMAGVEVLMFHACNSLNAADIEQLSAALASHEVKLLQLSIQVSDDDEARNMTAALCATQPAIQCLAADGLDDSRPDATTGEPYVLTAALLRSAAPTRQLIGLEHTRVPTTADLLAMQPLDQEKLRCTQFYLANGEFADLTTHMGY
jgi:hypothetical protein